MEHVSVLIFYLYKQGVFHKLGITVLDNGINGSDLHFILWISVTNVTASVSHVCL
jgi:hypothetical protein